MLDTISPQPALGSDKAKSQEYEYHLQLYRNNDNAEVQQLYINSMLWHPHAPLVPFLKLVATGTNARFLYLSSALGAVMWPWYPHLGPLISLVAGGVVLVQLGLAFRWIRNLIKDNIKEDLVDVAKQYGLVPPSTMADVDGEDLHHLTASGPRGFWVVHATHKATGKRELVGCGGLDIIQQGDESEGEIRRVVVSSRHIRQGVATVLLEGIIAHAQSHNLPSIYLETSSMQKAAIQLYKKYGWIEEERQGVNLFGTTIHAVRMRLYFRNKPQSDEMGY